MRASPAGRRRHMATDSPTRHWPSLGSGSLVSSVADASDGSDARTRGRASSGGRRFGLERREGIYVSSLIMVAALEPETRQGGLRDLTDGRLISEPPRNRKSSPRASKSFKTDTCQIKVSSLPLLLLLPYSTFPLVELHLLLGSFQSLQLPLQFGSPGHLGLLLLREAAPLALPLQFLDLLQLLLDLESRARENELPETLQVVKDERGPGRPEVG